MKKKPQIFLGIVLIIFIYGAVKYSEFSAVKSYDNAMKRNRVTYHGNEYYEIPVTNTSYETDKELGKMLEIGVNTIFNIYINADKIFSIKNDEELKFIHSSGIFGSHLYCREDMMDILFPKSKKAYYKDEECKFNYGDVTAIMVEVANNAYITKKKDIDWLISLEKIDGKTVSFAHSQCDEYQINYCYNNIPLYDINSTIAVVDNQYVYSKFEYNEYDENMSDMCKGVVLNDKEAERLEKIVVEKNQVFRKANPIE